jgi:hypothetical protein
MRVTVLASVAVISLASSSSAQRFTCVQADSILLLGAGPRADLFSAVNRTMACRTTAPAVITSMLRRAIPGTTYDTLAIGAATAFADERLSDSVIVLVRDPAAASDRRLLFLALLTRYTDCRTGLDTSGFGRGEIGGLTTNFHVCGPRERQRLSPTARSRARDTIAWLSKHDPDVRIRALARNVGEKLESWETTLGTAE